MKSSEYWKRRQAREAYRTYKQAEDFAAQLAKIYRKATGRLNNQAEEVFKKFRVKYHLSEKEARRLLSRIRSKDDIEKLIKLLEAAPNSVEKTEILKELEAPAFRARLERFRQLQDQIDHIMKTVYKQEKTLSSVFYTDLANEAYYKSIFQLQQRAEAAFSFAKLDPKAVDRVVNSKWSGRNYSERIWGNTRLLADELKEEFIVSFLTGRGERETARIIANKFSQGATAARRLVRTESNHVYTEMNMEAYKEAGVEEYLYLATLDLRTSKICRSLDGKIFRVKDRVVGKNCPPMHPWCRSTTIAVIDRELLKKMQRSALDPVTGKRIKVPLTMKYDEWYEKYVKGREHKIPGNEKDDNNLDRQQYERYKGLNGVVPETYEEFLEVKYKEPDEYVKLKLAYKDKRLLERIRKDYNLRIHEGQQGKHIRGHNNYNGKSYLMDDVDPQKLVDQYAGTGEIKRGNNGKWINRQFFVADRQIGVVVDEGSGKKIPTKRFSIEYSKTKGTHIVPRKEI